MTAAENLWYQSRENGFLTSNEIQQNINWRNVPVPKVSPSPTPIPQISLEMDEAEVHIDGNGMATITGAVGVEQGSVAAENLIITVNGEPWRAELMRNGEGYTFSASGSIPEGVGELEVQAEVRDMGVASRVQRMIVIAPTPAPTATPAPILSVELDNGGQNLMSVPGARIEISGVINVQGAINAEGLTMLVNGAPCEMQVQQINQSQYEFVAGIVLPESATTELSVQVKLGEHEIYSRAQRIFLVTPSPTPNPEIYVSLSDAGVEYVEGQSVTVRGNIEIVSGEVAPEDLALYVRGVRWDMALEPLSDGTYGFTAENNLMDGSISQLDVKVRLLSNSQVVSNAEKLTVSTPVPTATPSPTPRPVVTPPPTEAPTDVPETPEPSQTAAPEGGLQFINSALDGVRGFANDLSESGKLPIAVAVLVVIVLLIAALIVLLVRRARKRKEQERIEPVMSEGSNFSYAPREDDSHQSKTVRQDSPDATRGSDEEAEADTSASNSSNTMRVNTSGGSLRLDLQQDAGGVSGTVRIEEDEGFKGGTVRMEEQEYVSITLEESRQGQKKDVHKLEIACDDELIVGRCAPADVVIDDDAVSSRHMTLSCDGDNVYVVDLGSTNGTSVNGEKIAPRTPRKIESGDELRVGRTKLAVRIEKSSEGVDSFR